MAFRVVVARRWPASSSSQVQAALRPGRQQTRAYADEYTGKALNEKEKAAETRYIKKMEEENKLKKAAGAVTSAASTAADVVTPEAAKGKASAPTAESGYRNTAVVAGLIAAVAGYWLLSGSSKKEEKEST